MARHSHHKPTPRKATEPAVTADAASAGPNTDDFLRLFSLHQPQIFGFLLSLVPNWNDAQDLLQETSIVLWKSFSSYRPGSNFQAWACQVALHQVFAFRKKQKRLPLPMGDRFLDVVAAEIDLMGHSLADQLQALSVCVAKLKPDDADLLKRCYAAGITTKQVAAELGSPPGTVYKTLSRIRRRLFLCIQKTLSPEARK